MGDIIHYSECCGKIVVRDWRYTEKRFDVVGKYKPFGPHLCSRCKKITTRTGKIRWQQTKYSVVT